MTAFHPATIGWLPTLQYNSMSISVNTESMSVAMSVNMGIMRLDNLYLAQPLNYPVRIRTSEGTFTYVINEYFDIRFYKMDAIYCMTHFGAVPSGYPTIICALSIAGTTLALPIFNPFGGLSSSDALIPCTCPSSEACQSFRLLSGYILFDINIWQRMAIQPRS
jgi:hypothetical protein